MLFLVHFGPATELLAFHRKKKSKKKESSSDESDAEEQVVWMEKKSISALLAVWSSREISVVA